MVRVLTMALGIACLWGQAAGQGYSRATAGPSPTGYGRTPVAASRPATAARAPSANLPRPKDELTTAQPPAVSSNPYIQLIRRADDIKVAVSAYLRLCKSNPDNVAANDALAERARRADNQQFPADGAAILKMLGDENPQAWAVLARLYAARSEWSGAATILNRIRSANDDPIVAAAVKAVTGQIAQAKALEQARARADATAGTATPSSNPPPASQAPAPSLGDQIRRLDAAIDKLTKPSPPCVPLVQRKRPLAPTVYLTDLPGPSAWATTVGPTAPTPGRSGAGADRPGLAAGPAPVDGRAGMAHRSLAVGAGGTGTSRPT